MNLIPARFRWILLLSLALNLALAAYLVMRPSSIEHRGRGHSMVLPPPHVIARVLSEDGRQILDQILDQHRPQIRPSLHAFAAARRAIQDLLRAPTVERATLTNAFAELRQREQDTAALVQSMLIELSLELPLADRQKLADVLVRPGRRSGERRNREGRERKTAESQGTADRQQTDVEGPAQQP